VLELLTVTPSVRIWDRHPASSGAFWGIWKLIWSSPAEVLRPLVADGPPAAADEDLRLGGKIARRGRDVVGNVTGPSPVP